jgi:hypothetical protein
MPRFSLRCVILFAALLFCRLAAARAETLRIVSTPAGATVELNGVLAGTTPSRRIFRAAISIARGLRSVSGWSIP